MSERSTGFWMHVWMVVKHAFHEFKWGRDLSISTAISLIGAAIMIWGNAVPQRDQRLLIISLAAPYIVVFGFHIGYKLLTAPWRLHQAQEREMETLREFQKAVEEKEVYLEPNKPLCATFITDFNWGTGASPGLALRSGFTNNRKPEFPGKTGHRVKANITYFDGEREPFTVEGRWVRTNQPAAYSPLQDKTEILRVDFEPGTYHELDIANKMPFEPGCYAVAWDDLRARMLVGPIVKVKIELVAEHVYQVFEFALETSEGKLNQLE